MQFHPQLWDLDLKINYRHPKNYLFRNSYLADKSMGTEQGAVLVPHNAILAKKFAKERRRAFALVSAVNKMEKVSEQKLNVYFMSHNKIMQPNIF